MGPYTWHRIFLSLSHWRYMTYMGKFNVMCKQSLPKEIYIPAFNAQITCQNCQISLFLASRQMKPFSHAIISINVGKTSSTNKREKTCVHKVEKTLQKRQDTLSVFAIIIRGFERVRSLS